MSRPRGVTITFETSDIDRFNESLVPKVGDFGELHHGVDRSTSVYGTVTDVKNKVQERRTGNRGRRSYDSRRSDQ